MWSKFCKNSILQGTVDFYCLACEFLLRSEDEVNAHIDKSIHKKNFDKTACVASCSEDRIRKVNKGYYCEHCNVHLTTMTKVNLHISDEEHLFNKTDGTERNGKPSFLKWVRNAVIAFDDLLIDEGAWNGLVEDTCVVCDTEYDDPDVHRSEASHILKVIQSKVQFGGDNSLSRKIDDSTYQCLTCNAIVMANALPTHFDAPAHKKKYLECRKLKRVFTQTNNENADPNANKAKENKNGKDLEKPNQKEVKTEQKKPESKEIKATEPKKIEPKEVKEKEVKTDVKPKEVKTEAKPKILKTESTEKETKVEKVEPQFEENIVALPRVEKKNEIPKEFLADINKVLGTNNYIKVEGDELHCIMCGWKLNREIAALHLLDEHHQTMERLQKRRNEEVKKMFNYQESKVEKTVLKPEKQTVEKTQSVKSEKQTVEKMVKADKPTVEKTVKPQKQTIDKTVKSEKQSVDNTVKPKKQAVDKEEAEANKTKILDAIQIFQKKDVLIDLISEKAFCKKCSLTLSYTFEDIETHIEEHNAKKENKVNEKYPKHIDNTRTKACAEEVKPEVVETTEDVEEPIESVESEAEFYIEDESNKEDENDIKGENEIEEFSTPDTEVVVMKTEEKPEKTPKKANQTKNKTEDVEDAAAFAASNNLTYNRDFNKAFCRICNTKIPSSIKSMREHVNGNLHKTKSSHNQPSVADMRPPSPQYRTEKMEDFVKNSVVYETRFAVTAIVNEEYAMSVLSLLMITKNELNRLRCHVCEKGLVANEVEEHSKTRKHTRAMDATPVVLLRGEFVREVRPGVFHCGFCNLVEAGWDTVQRHLASNTHSRNKMAAAWSLEESLPAIREHRARREHLEMLVVMRMLMGNQRFF